MSKSYLIITLVLLLFSIDSSAAPIVLHEGQNLYKIENYLDVYRDPSNKLTIPSNL